MTAPLSVDETHDPALKSWCRSANGHRDFPIQNLPLGIFSEAKGRRRPGVAIGDYIVDLVAIAALTYGVYFRRHLRRDMLLAYVALNVGVMAIAIALSSNTMTN